MALKTTGLSLALITILATRAFAQDSTAVAPVASSNNIFKSRSDTTRSILGSFYRQIEAPIAPQNVNLRSLALPGALIAYGALALVSKDLKTVNRSIRDELSNGGPHKERRFDNYAKYMPAVAVYGLNIAGVKGKHNLVDRTMLYGLSNVIGGGITLSAKRLTNVVRPDSSDRHSFPSGHATGAFIAAEFLRQEYKDVSPWYSVAGYAVAAGTGFLRMYNNKHWLNDVVAGAGVGILSTRIAYWLYPVVKNAFLKNKNGQTLVAPSYRQGSWGLSVVHSF